MRNGLLKNLILGSVVLLWNSTVSAQIEKTLIHEGLENRSTNFESVILFQAGKQAAARKGDLFVVWNVETAEVLREKDFEGENFLWDIAGEAIIYRAYNGVKHGLNLCKLADFKVTALPISMIGCRSVFRRLAACCVIGTIDRVTNIKYLNCLVANRCFRT